MSGRFSRRDAVLMLAALGAAAAVPGAGLASPLPIGNGARAQINVRSLAEMKFNGVVRQQFDVSCGAAAVATLLTYFYGDDRGERDVIETVFEFGDKEKIQKDGFSMLELKRYGERAGYVVQGYRIPDVESLAKLEVPALTLVNTRGYNHFVVLRGVRNGRVLLADPAFGNIKRPLNAFQGEWGNVVLLFLSKTSTGNDEFVTDHSLNAPDDQVILLVNRVLHSIRPAFNEF